MVTLVNTRVFDGRAMLPGLRTVRIAGNKVQSVDQAPPADGDQIMDASGLTLMPGLISCHMHADFYRYSLAESQVGVVFGKEKPPGVMMAIGVRTCRVLLESGFTGFVGASCAHNIDVQLKMAIADDIMAGPRIKACGHHISTTANLNENRMWWQRQIVPGTDIHVDGPDELRKLVREEVSQGAEMIKIFASAGHGYPGKIVRNIDSDELQAVCDAAHGRAALVRAHVADKAMMLECIEAGVDVIDHGDEMDEEVVEAMVERGTFWVPSFTQIKWWIDNNTPDPTGVIRRSYDGVRRILPIADKAGVRILLGDDYSGFVRDLCDDDPLDHQAGNYGRELGTYAGVDGITAEDVLRWGTRNGGELLADVGEKVGVIEAGALADLILVEGDPLEDLGLFARPETSLKAVIGNGRVLVDRMTPARACTGVIAP